MKAPTYPRALFADLLAAYAAGKTVNWKPGYKLTGPPDDPSVTFPANGNACGLFHVGGEISSYSPEEFTIEEPPPLLGRITPRLAVRNGDTVWLGSASITCAPFNRAELVAALRDMLASADAGDLDSLANASTPARELLTRLQP